MERLPIFVINGFLEAGKTQFMKFTMQQEYFQTEGNTLLIVCEEGEEEYDKELLESTHTTVKYIDDISDFTKEKMVEFTKEVDPERILIEWNGLWEQDKIQIPDIWYVNQMITIYDTSTLDLYIKNKDLKAYMGKMLKDSELVICNRADNIDEEILSTYHLQIKAMAPNAEIIFEGEEGEITGDFSINLPYNLDDSKLVIKPEEYGIFYVDAMDRTEKYDGKEVEFVAQVVRPDGIGDDILIPGRRAMTCCEADIQFLGFVCHYKGAKNFKNKDWVKVKGKIKYEMSPQYRAKGPVIYANDILLTGPIDGLVQF
ncbi:CobW/P47K family protein [Lachnoanaerobaculum sp. ICM7]|uniref:TIGR03943 family putative permease subunit n=1 Tax=Lachnoanaerobaculum sp. ICM7 TaxID=936594 RepID=UPI00027A5509|nr:GTP-binding protein [Lachnoanaerobaculum sp. ICM7]EJP20095.1 CobW/P47K family protein [Lachnoanaerobaculum sp. ICM7]